MRGGNHISVFLNFPVGKEGKETAKPLDTYTFHKRAADRDGSSPGRYPAQIYVIQEIGVTVLKATICAYTGYIISHNLRNTLINCLRDDASVSRVRC
jgi:hypothetical protein